MGKSIRYRSDVLLNTNGDCYINPLTNDFDFGASDDRHINDGLVYAPGWSKRYASFGVGAASYLKSKEVQQTLPKSIRLNLSSDGYQIDSTFSFKNFSILDIVNNASLL